MTPDTAREDLRLALGRVALRDAVALEDVYRATSSKLFGVCLRILHDREEAEDVLQEVYLSVWAKAGQYDPARVSPITWLAAVARNRAIDRVRARPRASSPLEAAAEAADPSPSAVALMESDEDSRRLRGCLDELEANSADAIRTAFFEGCTYEVLALRIGAPLGTVKGWIRRGLQRLKGCLER